MRRIHSILLLIAAVVMFAAAPTFAQSEDDEGATRSERNDRHAGARQAERSSKRKSKVPKVLFPLATRAEPKATMNGSDQRIVQKILDLSQGSDEEMEKALAEGTKYLSNAKTKPYPRAFVNRVLADVAMTKDDFVGATTYLRAAIEADALSNDQHYLSMVVLAQTLINDDKPKEGLTVLDRMLAETQSDNPDYVVFKANALYQMERYPEAIEVAKKLIASRPEPKDSWMRLLIASYAESDQQLEAARVMRDLVARHPDDKALLLNLAGLYQQAEDIDAAIGVLNDMRQRGLLDTDRDYRNLYALYSGLEGHDADVIAVINEGLEKKILQPSVEAYTLLAQTHYYAERLPEAIAAYKQAEALATDGETSLNLSRIYSGEAQWKESKAAAQAALAKGVKRPGDAWVLIGRAEYGVNNRAGMTAAMKKAATFPETKASAEEWLRKNKVK